MQKCVNVADNYLKFKRLVIQTVY